jgi:hypothetical protein
MKSQHTLALIGASFGLLASTAGADIMDRDEHHFGVWVQLVDNAIVTGGISHEGDPIHARHRVFGAEFGEIAGFPFVASEPGFQLMPGSVAPGTPFGINIADSVMVWNGAGFDATSETMTLEYLGLEAESGAGYVDGFEFTADSGGGFHNHFNITLNGPAGLDPADGVYLLPLTLDSAGGAYAESETFWFVMNLNEDEMTHEAALEWVESNLIPAPGAFALLLLSGGAFGRRRRSA